MRFLRSRPERLKKWIRQGCFAQVTGGALTGGFGAASQQNALRWIAEGDLIHFRAVGRRAQHAIPSTFACNRRTTWLFDRFGEEKARALFHDNPLVGPSRGRQLPHLPDLEE